MARRIHYIICQLSQVQGTLGRKLIDGAKKVKIFGEEISVNARIEMIEGFSGHADKDGLLQWIEAFHRKPSKIFIVHGEEESTLSFAKEIDDRFGIDAIIPEKGESFVITADKVIKSTETVETEISFKRLAIIDMLETLKEEIDELSDIIINDLKNERSDVEVDELRAKLKCLENSIVDALK